MHIYDNGFDVYGKSDWADVNWLYNEKASNEKELLFQAYDANLWPLPNFSTWKDKNWKQKQIEKALKFTKDFTGEVWLDDTKIKG